jgi:hypothetical protein
LGDKREWLEKYFEEDAKQIYTVYEKRKIREQK